MFAIQQMKTIEMNRASEGSSPMSSSVEHNVIDTDFYLSLSDDHRSDSHNSHGA